MWLASNFSPKYNPWIICKVCESYENDHLLKKLLIVKWILLVIDTVNVEISVWIIWIPMLEFIGLRDSPCWSRGLSMSVGRGCLVLIGKTRCPLTGSLHWQIVKWVYAHRNCADNLTQCHGVTSKLAKWVGHLRKFSMKWHV